MSIKYSLPPIKEVQTKVFLEHYFNRVRGEIVPGAHRIHLLLEEWLNQGILQIPSLLITGSNGKGTTCAFLESLLRTHGCKTGLYTSPHLIHPSERIRVAGLPVSEEVLLENLEIITEISQKKLHNASFFELTTATALLIFFKHKIDVLICEVGLGGHFDSTNILSPLVSVLTSVSIEHPEYLGDSLQKIASDKSYISRRNKPFIVAELKEEAVNGVKNTVEKTGSRLIFAHEKLPSQIEDVYDKLTSCGAQAFFARINAVNLRTALSAFYYFSEEYNKHTQNNFCISSELLTRGIVSTIWPGRFDLRKVNGRDVIFDASHNPEGFTYFLSQYQISPYSKKEFILLFASLNDKDWISTFKLLPELTKEIILTQTESARSESVTKFIDYFQDTCSPINFKAISKLDDALEYAINCYPEYPLVITGSIAFIGTALQRLHLPFIEI